MQQELQDKYKGKWTPFSVEHERSCLSWMIKVGKVIVIIKKRGEKAIMSDSEVRDAFIEELVDVMMFYYNTLACYEITSDELSEAYIKKHLKNMGRDFMTKQKVGYNKNKAYRLINRYDKVLPGKLLLIKCHDESLPHKLLNKKRMLRSIQTVEKHCMEIPALAGIFVLQKGFLPLMSNITFIR